MTQNGSFELIPELNKRAKGYLSSTSVLITLQGRDTIAGKTTTVIYIFYLVFSLWLVLMDIQSVLNLFTQFIKVNHRQYAQYYSTSVCLRKVLLLKEIYPKMRILLSFI